MALPAINKYSPPPKKIIIIVPETIHFALLTVKENVFTKCTALATKRYFKMLYYMHGVKQQGI